MLNFSFSDFLTFCETIALATPKLESPPDLVILSKLKISGTMAAKPLRQGHLKP
jgi:hypothetical protein